jgi:hypothetical protein
VLAKGAYLGEFWVGTILDPLDKLKVDTLHCSFYFNYVIEFVGDRLEL